MLLAVSLLGACVILTSGLLLPMNKSNGEPDVGSIIYHVSALEKTMLTFRKQFQTNTIELEMLKAKLKATEDKLQTTSDELIVERTKLNSLEKSANTSRYIIGKLQTDVSFEVVLTHPRSGQGHLKFDSVKTNIGKAYNTKSGKFSAPVSGTYLFWANIRVATNHNDRDNDHFIILMTDGGKTLNSGFGHTSDNSRQDRLAITHVVHLKEGASTNFQMNSTAASAYVMGRDVSSYGGALLHSD